MPFTISDVENHIKGLSKKQKKKWVAIANGILLAFEQDGKKGCEAKAIQIANLKFEAFNPVMTIAEANKMKQELIEKKDGLEIPEMEIFRSGTHNGDEFTDKDLEDIASNFQKLKGEVRPKLKITHEENQKSLAGLASYGDIVDVFVKTVEDGTKRLFAKIANVPKQVIDFIKERRFPERSIELYPKFKLGTQTDSPIYRNVLKAIALLGQEMPAVTGMEPIQLSEHLELQETVCFGEVCFFCEEEAKDHVLAKALSIEADMKIFQSKLSS